MTTTFESRSGVISTVFCRRLASQPARSPWPCVAASQSARAFGCAARPSSRTTFSATRSLRNTPSCVDRITGEGLPPFDWPVTGSGRETSINNAAVAV